MILYRQKGLFLYIPLSLSSDVSYSLEFSDQPFLTDFFISGTIIITLLVSAVYDTIL